MRACCFLFGGIVIGIFDSGIGGLTVLKALRERFPHESFIYLGDTARLPYGPKSPETIRKYLEQNIRFLMTKQVKALVVACNSASTVLHEDIYQTIPIYGTIKPGAIRALQASKTKRIGVIGTRATIASHGYPRAILACDAQAQVFSQACPLLVPLVEEGWIDDPITNLVLYRYIQPLIQSQIDTLILGCTHYPVLAEGVARVVGSGVTLVDSAQAIADQIELDMQNSRLQANSEGHGQTHICATDTSPTFKMVAEMILGEKLDSLELVQLY